MKNEKLFNRLMNPFIHLAGWKAFFIGIAIVCATVVIGSANNLCYPGTLDAKFVPEISLKSAVVYQVVGLLSIYLVAYIASLLFAKHTRFQDILGTITLSRYPYLLISLLGFMVKPESVNNLTESLLKGVGEFSLMANLGLIIASFLMIPIVIWHIALLYNAFKVSTGLTSSKAIPIFIGVVLLAETISVGVIYAIG